MTEWGQTLAENLPRNTMGIVISIICIIDKWFDINYFNVCLIISFYFICLLNYEDGHFNISLEFFFYKPALHFTEVLWNNILRHMQSPIF